MSSVSFHTRNEKVKRKQKWQQNPTAPALYQHGSPWHTSFSPMPTRWLCRVRSSARTPTAAQACQDHQRVLQGLLTCLGSAWVWITNTGQVLCSSFKNSFLRGPLSTQNFSLLLNDLFWLHVQWFSERIWSEFLCKHLELTHNSVHCKYALDKRFHRLSRASSKDSSKSKHVAIRLSLTATGCHLLSNHAQGAYIWRKKRARRWSGSLTDQACPKYLHTGFLRAASGITIGCQVWSHLTVHPRPLPRCTPVEELNQKSLIDSSSSRQKITVEIFTLL